MVLQGTPLLLSISTLTALSFCLIGYDNGVIGGLTQTPGWNRAFNNPDADLLSTIVSIYEIGSAVGALITFVIGERIGRKRTLSLGATVMIVGAILQASAFSTAQMIAARVVSGVGMGLINSTAQVLQAEVSPKASRGRYVCAQLSTLNFGTMISYWLDYGTTERYSNDFSWRFPIAFQLVFIIPILILSFIVTESPRWLEYHDRPEESRYVIAKLQGRANQQKHPDVEERYREIADSVANEKAIEVTSFKSMFVNDRMGTRRRLLTACSVQFFQQLGGINAINYYAGFLFNTSIGFDVTTANLMGGVLFTWFFVASFIPWLLIDSWGRRPLLIGSVALMACVFAAMSGLTHQIEINATNAHTCAIAAVVMVFIYLGAFTTGFQATVWCYTPEVLPLKIRAKGTALATFCNWIINFMVVKVFPIMIANIGVWDHNTMARYVLRWLTFLGIYVFLVQWKTYVVFTIFNFSFLPVMYLFYVETKGRSLEEIDLIFEALHEGRHVHDVEKEQKGISDHREKSERRL